MLEITSFKKEVATQLDKMCAENDYLFEVKTSVSYPTDIYDETANKLHEAGYSILKTYYNYHDISCDYIDNVTISWENAE